jgi:phenylalanyl-tRNA synthetase beta chain
MKVSWRWLGELADLAGVSPDEAARLLPLRTADVEGVERIGALDGVVTARVLEVAPHPGADRLRLCTVDHGAAAPLQVVCGAPNVAKGQTVCFARVGTTLPNGLTLKKAKIRGVESEGMICAEDELGLGTAHDGILVLPDGPVGRPAGEALGISDVVLDLNNTGITNRPDLWGHLGVARECAAVFGRALRPPGTTAAEALVARATGPAFPVAIEDPASCRRYVGLVLEGVADGPSPDAVRRRLEAVGLRSVGRLVDLTNLVMLETGQPLHAFDLREVRGGRVVVRRAGPGETMRTLDGKDLVLSPEDLVIADAERVLALAGVMGGAASGVRGDTTAVLLESACFDAARVRRSAIRHGLRTDASARFEKSLDPEGCRRAALRFVEVVAGQGPGVRAPRAVADAYPRPYPPVEIALDPDLVRRRLGVAVDDAVVEARLASVGFGVTRGTPTWRVRVPSWRATKDVALPEDLVEEVGRLHGYEHVRPLAPTAPMRPLRPTPARALERDGRASLCLALGYVEIATYAFHGAAEAERLGTDPAAHVRLVHPLSAEQDRLQTTCTQNLLATAARNQPREASLALAEWTRVFVRSGAGGASRPEEVPVLGLLRAERDATDDPKGATFLATVGDVMALLARWNVPDVTVGDAGEAALVEGLPPPPWLHPGRRAVVRSASAPLALVGEVLPQVAAAFGLAGRAAVAEIHLGRVLATDRTGRVYHGVPRFPWSPFDVAVIVPRKTPAADVAKLLAGVAPGTVRSVALFDVYEGAGIPEGHRSLAFTVTFGDDEGTMKPATLEKLMSRAIEVLRRAGFTVRTADARPA